MAEDEGVILVDGEEEFSVPSCLLEDEDIFTHVMSRETWDNILTDTEREHLLKYLPQESTDEQKQDMIKKLFDGENFKFGNPIGQFWDKLSLGTYTSEIGSLMNELKELKYHLYKQFIHSYHVNMLEDLLLSKRRLINSALDNGSLDNLEVMETTPTRHTPFRIKNDTKKKKVESKYRKLLKECSVEGNVDISSDEENTPTSEIFTEDEYQKLLKRHIKRRRMKKFDGDLNTRGITLSSVAGLPVTANSTSTSSSLKPDPTAKSEPKVISKSPPAKVAPPTIIQQPAKDTRKWEGLFYGPGSIYEKYGDPEKIKGDKSSPIILEGPLPTGQFLCYMAMLKRSFESIPERKGDLSKITEIIQVYLDSPEGQSCSWVSARSDWSDLILSALCYLGAEVGAVSSFDPLAHYYPIVEFKDRIDHWKWLGNQCDSDIELLVLNNHWIDTLDKALTVVDYTDYTPFPSLIATTAVVRPSKHHEAERFKQLEQQRYGQPHKAFTYKVHGYESSVGPVKGAKTVVKKEQGSRARGHALLKQDRPNCVTILSLVRDACSRLPNGEGTRLDLCILLRDSQFITDNVTDGQLNNAVSGALDRLHYEKDPCVRYISSKKLWLYLHRNRSEEEFEHISWATEFAIKNRKSIVSRGRHTPKILLRDMSGQLIDVSPSAVEIPKKPTAARNMNKSSPKVSKGNTVRSNTSKATKPRSTGMGGAKEHKTTTPAVKPVTMATTGAQPTLESDNDSLLENELPFLPTTEHKDTDHILLRMNSDSSDTSLTNLTTATSTNNVVPRLISDYNFQGGAPQPAPPTSWMSSDTSNTESD